MEVDGQEVDFRFENLFKSGVLGIASMTFSESSGGKLSVCVGAECGPISHLSKQKVTCVLCQESQEIGFKNRAVVLATFVQKFVI